MKKLLSLVLVLVMALSLATAASATVYGNVGIVDTADNYFDGNAKSITGDVKIDVTATINPVYYVTVDWKEMVFAYTFGNRQWNPVNHTYVNNNEGWQKPSNGDLDASKNPYIENAVTVTNHSNESVTVAFAAPTAATNGVTTSVTANGDTTLTRADEITYNENKTIGECLCKRVSAKVGVSGTPDTSLIDLDNSKDPTVVAQITVTIQKP